MFNKTVFSYYETLYKRNKWYYATNLDGTLVDDYVRNMEKIKVYD